MTIIDNDDEQIKISNVIVISLTFIVIAGVLAILGSTTFKQLPENQLPSITNSSVPKSPSISSKTSTEKPKMTLDSICMQTDYASTCKNSLANSVFNGTMLDYVKAVIGMTIQQMNEAEKLSKRLVQKQTIGDDYQAINDCIEMITLAVHDLQEAFSAASQQNHSAHEIKNWLSAVISYQEACLEAISKPDNETDNEKCYEQSYTKSCNCLGSD
ncbi:Plant invertase/pectin methylesterase inhibitor superfamily [Euphorbia peplus]|nr:Plant invertase/pectin methylesterase inhibitor superfamily [Euphorbia peplus]